MTRYLVALPRALCCVFLACGSGGAVSGEPPTRDELALAAIEQREADRSNPSVIIPEIAANSDLVVVGRLSGYRVVRSETHDVSFVVYSVRVSQTLKGATSEIVEVWLGGVEGPTGPMLASDQPDLQRASTTSGDGVLFLRFEESTGGYIPAGQDWAYLPVLDTLVSVPSGPTDSISMESLNALLAQ